MIDIAVELKFGPPTNMYDLMVNPRVRICASTGTGWRAIHRCPDGPPRAPKSRHCPWGRNGYQAAVVHRYYDPSTAQFLSVDPAVDETGMPYAYTGADPVNEADPLGLDKVYIFFRNGKPYYVGRAQNVERRWQQHEAQERYCPAEESAETLRTGDLTTIEAAGLEQRVIETLHLENLENQRNEIAVNSQSRRWTFNSARDAADKVLNENPDALDQINAAAAAVDEPALTLPEPSLWSAFEEFWSTDLSDSD